MPEQNTKTGLKVLHFQIQDILLCIDIQYMQKVISLVALEAVPGSASYIVGLMNFAGKSIPVMDLGTRIGLARQTPFTLETPILLCTDGKQTIGLIVDTILHIATIHQEDIQTHEEFNEEQSFFIGTISEAAHISLLVDMKKILNLHLKFRADPKISKKVVNSLGKT